MTWWQRFRQRWRLERELDAELQYHVDRLSGDLLASGLSPEEARRRIAEEFGSVEAVKDACRDVRGTRLGHDLALDFRMAARIFVRERGLTALAVGALAIGLGVSTTLFTIVDALCLRTFPLADVDRLVEVAEILPSGAKRGLTLDQWRRLTEARVAPLESTAAYATKPAVVRDGDGPADRINVAYVSGDLFTMLRLEPVSGRGLSAADAAAADRTVIVIGDRLRASLASAGEGVPGRLLRVDGANATVVGAMPSGFAYPDRADAWRPLSALAVDDTLRLTAIGRLAPGAQVAQAAAAVDPLLREAGDAGGARIVVTGLDERYRNPVTNPAWLAFMTTAALLALIAGSNVATLLLARGARRHREIAIRIALGATRTRVVRQLLVETSLLVAAGGLAAVGVAALGLRLFQLAIPDGGIPYWVALTMSPRVTAALALTCVLLVALSGLAPALTSARAAARASLHDRGVTAPLSGRGGRRWTWLFLTTQLGLSVVLLSAVGLTTMNILRGSRSMAVDAERVLTFTAVLPAADYGEPAARRRFYDQLTAALAATGRVTQTALATALPPAPGEMRRVVVGASSTDADPAVETTRVGPGYFAALDQPLAAGRAAVATDGVPAEAVVNARFADLFLGGAALGHTFRLAARDASMPATYAVVGVVVDDDSGDGPARVFLPLRDADLDRVAVLAATAGPAAAAAGLVRNAARSVDADVPLTRLMPLNEVHWNMRWNARVSQGLITTIAAVALLLAAVGLTALTSQWVSQSGRELAVRVALGAQPRQIVWLVLRRVLLQLAVGLGAGAVGAWAWGRLFGPPGTLTAPANLLAVTLVVLSVTLVAAAWPARRASRVDPLPALRAE